MKCAHVDLSCSDACQAWLGFGGALTASPNRRQTTRELVTVAVHVIRPHTYSQGTHAQVRCKPLPAAEHTQTCGHTVAKPVAGVSCESSLPFGSSAVEGGGLGAAFWYRLLTQMGGWGLDRLLVPHSEIQILPLPGMMRCLLSQPDEPGSGES